MTELQGYLLVGYIYKYIIYIDTYISRDSTLQKLITHRVRPRHFGFAIAASLAARKRHQPVKRALRVPHRGAPRGVFLHGLAQLLQRCFFVKGVNRELELDGGGRDAVVRKPVVLRLMQVKATATGKDLICFALIDNL